MLNKNLFSSGDVVAVALSGGKDSVCLFHLLLSRAKELDITVKAINVEHGIRGESSINDSLFVKNLCEGLNVPLKALAFDCVTYSKENGLSVEEGARRLRYQSFLRLIEEGFCDKVATAHHLSDNVETVLLNLFRGASPSGLKGIPESAYNGKIIRPILNVTREDIDRYVDENGFKFVVDESNDSCEYSRNFLRLNVIPQIKSRFPEMESAIKRFIDVLSEEDAILSKQANAAVTAKDGKILISCSVENPIFARACVIAMKTSGITKDYDKAHIDGLVALKTSQNGKRISLLNGVVGVKEYDSIALYNQDKVEESEKPFAIGQSTVGKYNICVERCRLPIDYKSKKKGELYFDLDKIPYGAIIRTRQDGDTFTKFGGGTKNLGDYMTDKKVPLLERDGLPIIAVNQEVLILCGVEISDTVKIDSQTKNIAKIILN